MVVLGPAVLIVVLALIQKKKNRRFRNGVNFEFLVKIRLIMSHLISSYKTENLKKMSGSTFENLKISVKSSLGEYMDTVRNYYRFSQILQYLIEHYIF